MRLPALRIVSTVVCVTVLAAASERAAAAGSAYVTNYSSQTISQFDIGAGGLLSPKSPATVSSPDSGLHPAISMDGASLYVPEDGVAGLNIAQFDIGAGGLLSAKIVPEAASGSSSFAAAVRPDGRSAYVATQVDTIFQYDIGTGGILAPKSPVSVAVTASQFNDLAVSPDGQTLWAPDSDNARVAQFNIAADGTLSPKSPATVPAGSMPQGIVVSPDGRNVYVTNHGSASVAQYDVSASGALTPKTPTTLGTGAEPVQPAISPDGTNLYVPFSTGGVSQYDIGAGGALAPKSPASVPVPSALTAAAVAPGGRSAYFVGASEVSMFDVGPGGALVAKSPASLPVGLTGIGLALTPDRGPTAAFTAAPGRAGTGSLFDASGSSDPDGTLARYDWAFGDGTTAQNAGPSPSHTYAAPGSYQVTLTVADDLGCTGALVFTGQTASCAPSAGTVAHTITVLPAAFGASTRVTLRLAVRRIARGKPLVVDVSNGNAFAIRGTLSGRTTKAVATQRKRRVRLRAKAFQVRANARTRVRLRLPAALRRALTRRGRVPLRLRARVRDPAGNTRTVAKTVTLRLRR